jgi:hypothetical protein
MDESLASCFEAVVSLPEDSHSTKEEKEAALKEMEENSNWWKVNKDS